jgi:hypothetical protein
VSNLFKCLSPNPDVVADIAKIKKAVPFVQRFTDLEVQTMWKTFSRDACAGWLNVDDQTIAQFMDWISE